MAKPKHIGKYEILEEIGRGGFAVVYKARDTELDRIVALKVLHPYWSADPGFVARFRLEARAVAGLRHPNIVTVYDAGEAEGQLYIAVEYLPGRTLRELLEAEGALTLERALPILEQMAEALDYAHAQGVVHRDVKPGNAIVEETEYGVRATLMDFGLVKAMEGSSVLTSQGTLLGSPEYMAPEQADLERAAEIGPATDRYALGIVAYQMLTGRVPFPGNTAATLYAHEHKPVPPPLSLRPYLPEPVATALLKMLAKAPAERYRSTGDFTCALASASQEAIVRDECAQRCARAKIFLSQAADELQYVKSHVPDYPDPEGLFAAVGVGRKPPRRQPLWTLAILLVMVGFIAGLYVGWQVWPPSYVNATPGNLRSDFQGDYILWVAEQYATTGDLEWALSRLGAEYWKEGQLAETLEGLAQERGGQEATRLRAMATVLEATPAATPAATETSDGTELRAQEALLVCGSFLLVVALVGGLVFLANRLRR